MNVIEQAEHDARNMRDKIAELECDNREMRSILLRIHSARVAMNEQAVKSALNDVDRYFREPNTN